MFYPPARSTPYSGALSTGNNLEAYYANSAAPDNASDRLAREPVAASTSYKTLQACPLCSCAPIRVHLFPRQTTMRGIVLSHKLAEARRKADKTSRRSAELRSRSSPARAASPPLTMPKNLASPRGSTSPPASKRTPPSQAQVQGAGATKLVVELEVDSPIANEPKGGGKAKETATPSRKRKASSVDNADDSALETTPPARALKKAKTSPVPEAPIASGSSRPRRAPCPRKL